MPGQQQTQQPCSQLEQLLLDSVRIVLVAPKVPGNIGAVCRACANFETTQLWVVAPRCDPWSGEVARLACGEHVSSQLRVVDTLEEALADTIGSIGFTRRAGATRFTHGSVGELLQRHPSAITALDPALLQQPPGSLGTTALVFGREESGLAEGELRLCLHACGIRTGGRLHASLNLSHAVAVVLADVFERRLQLLGLEDNPGLECSVGTPQEREALQPAAASELAALLAKVAAIARAAGVSGEESRGGGAQGRHGRRRLPLGHIRAIMSRASASTWEVRSLHGLASAVLQQLEQLEHTEQAGGGDGRGGGE